MCIQPIPVHAWAWAENWGKGKGSEHTGGGPRGKNSGAWGNVENEGKGNKYSGSAPSSVTFSFPIIHQANHLLLRHSLTHYYNHIPSNTFIHFEYPNMQLSAILSVAFAAIALAAPVRLIFQSCTKPFDHHTNNQSTGR